MGALSSWGMLALTHHLIIQYSAYILGYRGRFKAYAVLGDDMVVWDKKVAAKYLSVMKGLGVEINLSKSIISVDGIGLEFAKKTLYKGKDVSPIPLKEYSAALRTSASFKAFVLKYNCPPSVVKTLLGLGYKSSRSRVWALWNLILGIPVDHRSFFTLISNKVKVIDGAPGLRKAKAFRQFMLNYLAKLDETSDRLTKDLSAFLSKIEKEISFTSDRKTGPSRALFTLEVPGASSLTRSVLIDPKVDKALLELVDIKKDIQIQRKMLSMSPASKSVGSMKHMLFWFNLSSCAHIILDVEKRLGDVQIGTLINPSSHRSISVFSKEEARLTTLWKTWKQAI